MSLTYHTPEPQTQVCVIQVCVIQVWRLVDELGLCETFVVVTVVLVIICLKQTLSVSSWRAGIHCF